MRAATGMSALKQIVILAAIVAAAGLAWLADVSAGDDAGASKAAASRSRASKRAAPVVVEKIRFESNAAVARAVGKGVAAKSVVLFPEAAGRITAVLFEGGARVKAGAPLVRLDDEAEHLAVKLARVHLDDARRKLERYERAAPTGAVPASEVDAARTALSAARIELAQAELALRKRTLVAPFDGIIGIPQVDPGERVTESSPVATLDDRSTVLIDFDVPETFAYGVREGAALEVTAWSLPGKTFKGKVAAVASQIDRETLTLRVRARVPNPDRVLRTGMSFIVRLPLVGDRFPSVPSLAVQWDRRGAHVWRVVDGRAERVAVDVLKRAEGWVLVDAPLGAADRVVVEGVQRLRPGMAVEVVSDGTA